MPDTRSSIAPALEIKGLNVYYGASHALQGVDLRVGSGVLSVVGRNGMGKTTLCKAVMGLVPVASGTISFRGQLLNGKSPSEISRLGIGYVPQGRRLWRSLSVDEHLRLVATPGGAWNIERIYDTFPRLAERKSNGGAQLSGGEQQMLAIGRALLLNPKLLVMDEPTEGLAPVIVSHVEDMLVKLAAAGEVDVLVIEQNIAVATGVAQTVAVMVNGQVNRTVRSSELAADRDLQQRLLGVGQHAHDEEPEAAVQPARPEGTILPYQQAFNALPHVNRWSSLTGVSLANISTEARNSSRPAGIVVIGAFDRFKAELNAISEQLKKSGRLVTTIDIALQPGFRSAADISAQTLSSWHPRGAAGVFDGRTSDPRSGLAVALQRYLQAQSGLDGVLALFDLGDALSIAPIVATAVTTRPVMIVSEASPADLSAAGNLIVFSAHDDAARKRATLAASLAIVGLLADEPQTAAGPELVLITGPAGQALSWAVEARFSTKRSCMRVSPNPGGMGAALSALRGGALAVLDLDQSDLAEALAGKSYATVPNRPALLCAPGRPYVSVLSGGSLHYQPVLGSDAMRLEALAPERAGAVGSAYAAALMAAAGDITVIVPTEPAGSAAAALNAAFLDAFKSDARRQVVRVSDGPLDPSVLQEVERALTRSQGSDPVSHRYLSSQAKAKGQMS
jgi:ABC-type branched-subunit amino acid transport system ATPase component